MKTVLFILVLFTIQISLFGQNRCRIQVDSKYGFIDTLGNIKIKPIFSYASQFSEGLAVIKTDKYFGYINQNGEKVIPENYEYASYFKNGIAIVGKNKKYGLIDSTGKLIVNYIYDWITHALINDNRVAFKDANLWGYMNLKGEILIKRQFQSVTMYHNGTAKIQIDDLYGIIDTLGNYILEPKYRMIQGQSFSNNRISVLMKGDKGYHYVNLQGKKINNNVYYQTSSYSEGVAFVLEEHDKLGFFIDTLGDKVFSDKFENGGPFINGYAVVTKNGKYGIINKSGIYTIKPKLDGIGVFYQKGLISYWKKTKKKNKYGLINLDGKIITKPIYSSILFRDGDCLYPELYKKGKDSYDFNSKIGYVNKQGKIIWKPQK